MPFTPIQAKNGTTANGSGFVAFDPKHAPAALSASHSILSSIAQFGSNTAESFMDALKQGKEDLTKNADVQESGAGAGTKIASEVKTGLDVGSDVASAATAPIAGGIKTAVDKVSDTKTVQGVAKNPIISAILDKTTDAGKKMDELTQKYPDAARAFGDILNIASTVGGGEGAGAIAEKTGAAAADVTSAAARGTSSIADKVGTVMKAKKNAAAIEKVTDIVSPRLDAKEAERATVEGRVTDPEGPLRTQNVTPSARTQKIAEAAQEFIDPKKSLTQNASSIKDGISKEAEDLKTKIGDADHPYTFKELQSTLNSVEIPELIKTGGPTMERAGRRVVSKFMEIARKGKGNVGELLDARKEFDAWVEKEYPKVFDQSGSTNGIQLLVKNVRTAANQFISENLPDGFGYQESLDKQNLLYDALDNVSEKAARGAPTKQGEVGSNILDRHPKTTDAVKKGAVGAIGILGGAEAIKHL